MVKSKLLKLATVLFVATMFAALFALTIKSPFVVYADAAQDKANCEGSGGTWKVLAVNETDPGNSTIGCACPTDKSLSGSSCVTKKSLCEGSGGQWNSVNTGVAGTVDVCQNCPSNKKSDGSTCVLLQSTTPKTDNSLGGPVQTGGTPGRYTCGNRDNVVLTGFDFGCRGTSYTGRNLNPIVDIAFAIYRFLSAGVGIIAVASIIIAGIQYSTARGNPSATQAAITRISNTLVGLLIYMFIFAIANFLVPGGIFT